MGRQEDSRDFAEVLVNKTSEISLNVVNFSGEGKNRLSKEKG